MFLNPVFDIALSRTAVSAIANGQGTPGIGIGI